MERKILNNCEETTMDKFIRCLCKHDYSCLIVSGDFTESEQQEAWNNIFYEYCDLTNSNDYKIMLKLMRSIGVNEAKITAINLCLIVLSHNYNKECVEILKKYGYNYEFDENNPESFLKDLQNVQNISKGAGITLQNDRKNFDIIMKKKQNSIKESDFSKTFIVLSKFMGFMVSENNTTVSKYCSIIAMLNKK